MFSYFGSLGCTARINTMIVRVPGEEAWDVLLEELEAVRRHGAVILQRLQEPPHRVARVVPRVATLDII